MTVYHSTRRNIPEDLNFFTHVVKKSTGKGTRKAPKNLHQYLHIALSTVATENIGKNMA
jgi:hypothetical protein